MLLLYFIILAGKILGGGDSPHAPWSVPAVMLPDRRANSVSDKEKCTTEYCQPASIKVAPPPPPDARPLSG